MAVVEGEMDDTSIVAAHECGVVVEHRAELADVEESQGRVGRTWVTDVMTHSRKLALRVVAREGASQVAV